MKSFVFPKSSELQVLCFFRDQKNTFQILFTNLQPPGLHLQNLDPRIPAAEQIHQALTQKLQCSMSDFRIELDPRFVESLDQLSMPRDLVCAEIINFKEGLFDNTPLATFPDMLKRLGKNRLRIPYLKALQLAAGVLEESIRVAEESLVE